MARKAKSPEISEAELRRMLLERRSQDRKRRLQAFLEEGELLPLDHEQAESAQGDPLASPRIRANNPNLPAPPRRKTGFDRLLIAVELLAVLGLVVVFAGGLNVLTELNSQVAALFEEAPTPSPTPFFFPVVLPSGHIAPQAGQEPQPNETELTDELAELHNAYTASLIAPTPSPEQAQRIRIDALDLRAPIVQGDDWEALKRGVGQHIGSANPGELGNLVLSGHNDIFGQVFRHLDQLEKGDEIVVHTDSRAFTYTVTNTMVVEPTRVEVMRPTPNATLTLISCYPYLISNQRIIVQAALQN